MPNSDASAINASQNKLLYLLKTRGAMGAVELASQLNMTSMGARQHLEQLEERGYLTHQFLAKGKGRPKKQWNLTPQSEALFPDGHSGLLVNLLGHMQSQLGQSAMEQLIISREKEMLESYTAQLSQYQSLPEKLRKLAEIRTHEGYMAEVIEQEDGFLLVENHCPICAAASQCQQFCRSELSIFQQVLNREVKRVDYILEGARRCAYQIT